MYQGKSGLINEFGSVLPSSTVEEFGKIGITSLLEFTREAIWSRAFLCWEVFDYWVNLLTNFCSLSLVFIGNMLYFGKYSMCFWKEWLFWKKKKRVFCSGWREHCRNVKHVMWLENVYIFYTLTNFLLVLSILREILKCLIIILDFSPSCCSFSFYVIYSEVLLLGTKMLRIHWHFLSLWHDLFYFW